MKRIAFYFVCLALSGAVLSDEIILDCVVDNYDSRYVHKYSDSGLNGPEVLVYHKGKWNQFCVNRGQKLAGSEYWARQIIFEGKIYSCITEYYSNYPKLSLTRTSKVDFNKHQYTRIYEFHDQDKNRKNTSITHECMIRSETSDAR